MPFSGGPDEGVGATARSSMPFREPPWSIRRPVIGRAQHCSLGAEAAAREARDGCGAMRVVFGDRTAPAASLSQAIGAWFSRVARRSWMITLDRFTRLTRPNGPHSCANCRTKGEDGPPMSLNGGATMKESSAVRPLSEALSEGITKVYTLGGLALTFVFAGTLLLIIGVIIGTGPVSYLIAGVGATLILVVVALFYQRDIKRLRDARRAVDTNAELIDAVQETAVNMTELAFHLQALAFKYADQIAVLITSQRERVRELASTPPLSLVPGVGLLADRLIDNEYVVRASDLSAAIVKTTESAKTVIEEVNSALVKSDPTALKKYMREIRELDKKVTDLLATGQATAV
jgi:hypothetical protein